jgi:hypothetical protein
MLKSIAAADAKYALDPFGGPRYTQRSSPIALKTGV